MSKFILLECNRDRAIDKTFDSGKKDIFKNKWTNQVSNSGIVVNAGDVLNIEETIVNSIGANVDVMEFTGKDNENKIVDNKLNLEVSYYINHTGKNTGNMPLKGHKIFRGIGDLRVLAFNNTDFSNVYVSGDQLLPYSANRYKFMIGDRSLGETFFGTLDATTMPYDGSEDYDNQDIMANEQKVFTMSLLQRGGGLANQPNTGYKEGEIITVTTDDTTAIGTTMSVKIESTITIGTIPNVIESFSIQSLGDKFFSGNSATGTSRITFPVGGGATPQIYEVDFVLLPSYESSDLRSFDGERYYPLQVGFTGLAFFNDSQVNNGQPLDPITDDFDINLIQSQPFLRTNEVKLNVPTGFSTPSNVANLLTQQLGKPEKLNENFNNGTFLDVDTFEFFHNVNGEFIFDGNPNIIASQTFQPHSCNWVNNGKNNEKTSSFVGRRQQFYSSIAWKEPERWIGLVPAFKQFAVNAKFFDENNDIAVARGTLIADNDQYGDFTRQATGEFGCHVSVIHTPKVIGTHNHNTLTRGELIVTNIRYTRRNLQRLINMKKCEKYMGDLSEKVDTSSDNFKKFLSVNLDIGIYDDEMSTQGKYTEATSSAVGQSPVFTGQKRKFATLDEAISSNFCIIDTDEGHLNDLKGFQRDLKNVTNQGQDLSNLWIKSRWDEKYRFKNSLDSDGDVIDLDNDIRYLSSFQNLDNDPHFNSNGTDIRQVFGNGYMTNEGFITVDEMNDMAKELDIAVIPVNVPVNPADATQNQEWREVTLTGVNELPPFLAFIVGANYGDPATTTFDKVTQFSGAGTHWVSDASNFKYGTILGFDPSFTRNKAVCMINNQYNGNTLDKNNFLNYVNLGSVNPKINFDTDFSRFAISGLNTPTFIGNGLTTDDPLEFTPSDNPEQEVVVLGRTNQVLPSRQKEIGTNPTGYDPATGAGFPPQILNISQFKDAKQKEGTIMDSQSGISLEKLILFDENENRTVIDPTNYFNDNTYLYHNCLFDKMGFDYSTLFPSFGSRNAFFRNTSLFTNKDTTYLDSIQNVTKPLTTGAKLTTEITQTFSVNQENAPLFDLGGDILLDPIQTDVTQGEITGNKLPTKFDFSYLTINSSLVSEGTDTIYIGGGDNQSKLPCMSYLTRENNESDFFYQSEKGFTFTATKDFTITDITTDIRLPNGDRPFLDSHSTIIYKIEKPIRSLPMDTQPIPTHTRPHSKKEEEEREKRNKDRK